MAFTTLISSAALSMHLDDAAWVVVDCRFKLDDVTWGEREYAAAHIPGAVYADLDHDLSAAKTGTNGRHPLPDAVALASTFSRLGITTGMQVVAYDQDNGMYASRLWWMLRYMMVINALGLNADAVRKYIKENKPSYSQFEKWVKSQPGVKLDKGTIDQLNNSIRGYIHADDTRKSILGASNIADDGSAFRDAVNLNNLDDWNEFHSAVLK